MKRIVLFSHLPHGSSLKTLAPVVLHSWASALPLPHQCLPSADSVPYPGLPTLFTQPKVIHKQTINSYFCSCSKHFIRCRGYSSEQKSISHKGDKSINKIYRIYIEG